jgi:hypothetical protein
MIFYKYCSRMFAVVRFLISNHAFDCKINFNFLIRVLLFQVIFSVTYFDMQLYPGLRTVAFSGMS